MRYAKILVAIDRSPLASEVFEQALELARAEKASLMLVHCLSRENWGDLSPFIQTGVGLYPLAAEQVYRFQQENLQVEVNQVQQLLRTYCQKAADQGVPAEFDYRVDTPGPRICNLARTWGADLIVLGRRGRRGLAEFVLGSVSNYVIHHASCSVLIAQGLTAPEISSTTTATSSAHRPSASL